MWRLRSSVFVFKTSKNHNSVKIVLDFTGVLRLSGNNSVIPLLTAAKKRHFYPPKLPALRAEVDGQTQKSVRPFSCFAACGFSLCRKPPAGVLLLRLAFPQRSRTAVQRPVFGLPAGTRSAGRRKRHKPPTRARQTVTGVLSALSTCVFNKIGIFSSCRILVQFLHLSVIVLLECRLNWSDGEA